MRRATAGGGGRHHVEVDGGADVVIRTPDRRLRVFVSSTVGEAGELAAERRAVVRAISTLRLTPVLFEAGARPYPPQELYRAYLAQSDIFVGLYWQRTGGSTPGSMEVSGLEEELQLSAGVPRLLCVIPEGAGTVNGSCGAGPWLSAGGRQSADGQRSSARSARDEQPETVRD
jgi:Domain of unknown function (DUF4062)